VNNGAWPQAPRMRDIETIDGELRLLARAWRVAAEMNCTPSTAHIDVLLDERSATLSRVEVHSA
jgi:hypothetical protein